MVIEENFFETISFQKLVNLVHEIMNSLRDLSISSSSIVLTVLLKKYQNFIDRLFMMFVLEKSVFDSKLSNMLICYDIFFVLCAQLLSNSRWNLQQKQQICIYTGSKSLYKCEFFLFNHLVMISIRRKSPKRMNDSKLFISYRLSCNNGCRSFLL